MATELGLTWAGLTPDEYAEKVAERARENVAVISAEFRGSAGRYRLRVIDDDADSEELYAYENGRFADPERAVGHVRDEYPKEYARGLYEVAPVYVRYPGDREQAVPFGEPLNGPETRYAVGYVRDCLDKSGRWFAEVVAVTPYADRASAEKKLAEKEAGEPGFDGYFLAPDRNEYEDDAEEPPDDDGDPLDDGTIGYDYYGPSWPTRDI